MALATTPDALKFRKTTTEKHTHKNVNSTRGQIERVKENKRSTVENDETGNEYNITHITRRGNVYFYFVSESKFIDLILDLKI